MEGAGLVLWTLGFPAVPPGLRGPLDSSLPIGPRRVPFYLCAAGRGAVLRGAESAGIAQDSPSHALLRAWLEERPDARIFEAWRDFVAALCAGLSIEGQLGLREDLLGRAREVAEAAGGFLGVRSISRREEAVLRELESAFPV